MQLAGGQTISGPYKVPTFLPVAGTITSDFTSLTAGTMTLTDASATPVSTTFAIGPQLPAP